MEKNRRVLLKLSGEALADQAKGGYNLALVQDVARQIKENTDRGIEVGIVIGGGNIWRGRTGTEIDRTKSDQIGMLATVMNCIYVSEVFRSEGLKTAIFTPFEVGAMTDLFSKDKAVKAFKEGKVCFFAGGTGHPYFSTDTGIVLRALELEVDEILLAKAVDGVYDSDPAKNPNAKKYDTVSIHEVVDKKLGVIDRTAAVMSEENGVALAVFDLRQEQSIRNALMGKGIGTRVVKD
ncbi:MAG: UMP kinase [Lachnospiraceae bacterium]|nr:UMP kinase [Lachnospiraceae bacterium]